jgi:hypothetical protein
LLRAAPAPYRAAKTTACRREWTPSFRRIVATWSLPEKPQTLRLKVAALRTQAPVEEGGTDVPGVLPLDHRGSV